MADNPLKRAVERVVGEHACDVYLYAGDIDRKTCDLIMDSCPEVPKPNALLMLSTFGGDVHAAYRLTRYLRNKYEEDLVLFIPTVCKSAGTLVAIGADELVMSLYGELGPLDVQVRERDELGEFRSGLVPTQALETVREEAFTFFEDSFLKLRARSGLQITTRTAAEIASQMTVGLFGPLVGQIDPLRVADIRLSMRIAEDYGQRLRTNNVKDDTIHTLVYEYPSHAYVLDRTEARRLFENVRVPTVAETQLAEEIAPVTQNSLHGEEPLAICLSDDEFLEKLHPQKDSMNENPKEDQSQRKDEEFDEISPHSE